MIVLDNIFKFILNSFRMIINLFIDNLLDPIFNKFLSFIPNLSDYMGSVTSFLNDYFFKGILFVKNAFCNITGYPQALLRLLVMFFAYKFTIMIMLFAVKYILNAYGIFRVGRSAYKSFGGKSS